MVIGQDRTISEEFNRRGWSSQGKRFPSSRLSSRFHGGGRLVVWISSTMAQHILLPDALLRLASNIH